ncbi:hypothetical protein ElyMa_006854200 [Elysia marginata]|uniref:Uncharacterized protein n=1 Tax=Elysia marginata TaxID=1093978 RepID=A0AAV4JAH5_9GAST|nr:hypothetical protein ElyMa_006854200 [Elysia marginata]
MLRDASYVVQYLRTTAWDAQHVLQDCPLLDDAGLKYWPELREMNQKLYGSALQLGITAEFIYASDLTI